MEKLLIWVGMFVGGTLGGMVPQLWGQGLLSGWGLLFSMLGGIAGVLGGYKLGRALS